MNWKFYKQIRWRSAGVSVLWAALIVILTYPAWVIRFVAVYMGDVSFFEHLNEEVISSSRDFTILIANVAITFFIGFDFFTSSYNLTEDKGKETRWKFFTFAALSIIISIFIFIFAGVLQQKNDISPILKSNNIIFSLWIVLFLIFSYMKYMGFLSQQVIKLVDTFEITSEQKQKIESMSLSNER